jgi:4'-phosphopantetheinyl transferase
VERARYRALAQEADRQRFVLGCVITRTVLGHHFGMAPGDVPLDRTCRDCGRPHGKVRDARGSPPVEMSVSHSGDRVAVAFCRGAAVGVDVERLDRGIDPAALSYHVLAETEAACVNGLAPSARAAAFITYWVRKEAILKATGVGLGAPLTDVVVSPPAEAPRLLRPCPEVPDTGAMRLHDLAPRPGYAAALAVMSPTPMRIREFSYPWRRSAAP